MMFYYLDDVQYSSGYSQILYILISQYRLKQIRKKKLFFLLIQKSQDKCHLHSKLSSLLTHQYKSGQRVKQLKQALKWNDFKNANSSFQFTGNRAYLSVGGW